jgi:acetoin utilization deacetylase AcuC-like enzyme
VQQVPGASGTQARFNSGRALQNVMRRRMHDIIPGILQDFKPDLILYDAGVDPHKDDALGRLALTTQGLLRRDTFVRTLSHRLS